MANAPYQPLAGVALPVVARDPPPEGLKIVPIPQLLTPTNYSLSTSFQLNAQSMSQVRTLFIDNSSNPNQLQVIHGVGLQKTLVPAAGGALIPTTSSQGQYFFDIATLAAPSADISVGLALYNYEIPPQIWGTQVVTVQGSIPTGAWTGWSGTIASIPAGWGLCDGTVYQRADGSGTIQSPDLRDKFIMGAGGLYVPGASGGSRKILQANLPLYNLTVTDPTHAHPITDPQHQHSLNFQTAFPNGASAGAIVGGGGTGNTALASTGITINAASTGISVSSAGGGQDFIPNYYAQAFIMKL